MSDQTPDSAERIAEDAQDRVGHGLWDSYPAYTRTEIEARINALISTAEERAKAEQAKAIRSALRENAVWGPAVMASAVYAILGTPTGGPDDRTV